MENEEKKATVSISKERYESLVKTETRVNNLVERICHGEYLSTEDILWMLDTEPAVKKAKELMKKACMERMAYEDGMKKQEGCELDE